MSYCAAVRFSMARTTAIISDGAAKSSLIWAGSFTIGFLFPGWTRRGDREVQTQEVSLRRPLRKYRPDGSAYTRPPEIEAAIDETIALDAATRIARAELRERTAAGFLPKEVLVYLISEAKRVDDQATITELFTILERRCEATLASEVPDSYQSGCLDERPVALREDARRGEPMAPGKLARTDYEYVRCGTANIFCIVEPLTGRRLTFATTNRKAPAFARAEDRPALSLGAPDSPRHGQSQHPLPMLGRDRARRA